jgi:hypothetical protein
VRVSGGAPNKVIWDILGRAKASTALDYCVESTESAMRAGTAGLEATLFGDTAPPEAGTGTGV